MAEQVVLQGFAAVGVLYDAHLVVVGEGVLQEGQSVRVLVGGLDFGCCAFAVPDAQLVDIAVPAGVVDLFVLAGGSFRLAEPEVVGSVDAAVAPAAPPVNPADAVDVDAYVGSVDGDGDVLPLENAQRA